MSDIFLAADGKIREWCSEDLDDDYQRGRTAGIVEERARVVSWLSKYNSKLAEGLQREEHVDES